MGDDVEVPGRLIRLANVPAIGWLPRRSGKPVSKPVSLSSVHRWVAKGVHGVKLRSMRVGCALCTTEAWLLEFFEALSEPTTVQPARGTPRRREAAREKAKRELERAGI